MSAKKKSKSRKWITFGIIAVILVGITVTFLLRPKETAYDSVNAKTGDISTYYSFSGNIETKNRQTVMSQKVMQVESILFKEGDTVKEGDVLIKTTTGDEIKSKINGVVVGVAVAENAQVMAGVRLLEIVDNQNLEIKIKVDEYDLSALEIDKVTTVKIGAIDKELTGKVKSMSLEGQTLNGVTFFTATIDLEQDNSLKIGMSAEVTILSEQVSGVVTLPMTAIQFDDNNNAFVLKEDEKGRAVKTQITTGINDGTTVEVKSGVSNEEKILYAKPQSSGGMGFGRGNADATGGGEN